MVVLLHLCITWKWGRPGGQGHILFTLTHLGGCEMTSYDSSNFHSVQQGFQLGLIPNSPTGGLGTRPTGTLTGECMRVTICGPATMRHDISLIPMPLSSTAGSVKVVSQYSSHAPWPPVLLLARKW